MHWELLDVPELVALCADGDSSAQEEFRLRYHRVLTKWAWDIARDGDLARDLVQQFFLDYFGHHREYLRTYRSRSGAKFETWLQFVFRRHAIRVVRRERHWQQRLGQEIPENWDPQAPSSDPDARRTLLAVLSRIELLESAERTVVERRVAGFSHREIETELGLHAGHSAMLLHRARQKLRQGGKS